MNRNTRPTAAMSLKSMLLERYKSANIAITSSAGVKRAEFAGPESDKTLCPVITKLLYTPKGLIP